MANKGLDEIFLSICEEFNKAGIQYVIIGGFAMIIHGYPRLTTDIDFFVNPSEENVMRIKKSLFKIFKDKTIEKLNVIDIKKYSVVRYVSENGFCIDFIGKIGKIFEFSDVKNEVEMIEIENVKIPVCSVEMLLRMKEKSVRPIDKQDVIFLREKIKYKSKNK
ncbi:MAG: nucleotidyl transferase AbiEii/AbiGii toxin family protein [Candidatus Ratteibacteria bacterium]